MNGGTCIDGIDSFSCSCPPKLTGMMCECLIIDNNFLDCSYISYTTLTTTALPITTKDVTTVRPHSDFVTSTQTTVFTGVPNASITTSIAVETITPTWAASKTTIVDFTPTIISTTSPPVILTEPGKICNHT